MTNSELEVRPLPQPEVSGSGASAEPEPLPPPASPRQAWLVVGIVLLVFLAAGVFTLLRRRQESRVLAKETEANTVLAVSVVQPVSEKPDEELVLPGSLQAYEESPIYARTSGYLQRWYKDIGSRVEKDELLAQIDAPELDQELAQARAARQQIEAQLQLARSSDERWENLRKTDSVSQQEADQQSSANQQAQANLAAADANVRRLEQLESYKHVHAPFSGVLTRRNVDPGALISAGNGGRQLFDVARVDVLRVYVSMPQAYSPAVKPGLKAWVTLQEYPNRKFEGTVARTADAIDPATRTLLTEVNVSNRSGQLLPGSFGQVHFSLGINVAKLTIPVNALLFRSEGPRVAVVGQGGKVELRAVSLGRDYGTTMEVLGGLKQEERVIVNPADSLEDGQAVEVIKAEKAGGRS